MNSTENMHTDIRVWGVNNWTLISPTWLATCCIIFCPRYFMPYAPSSSARACNSESKKWHSIPLHRVAVKFCKVITLNDKKRFYHKHCNNHSEQGTIGTGSFSQSKNTSMVLIGLSEQKPWFWVYTTNPSPCRTGLGWVTIQLPEVIIISPLPTLLIHRLVKQVWG